MKRIALITSGIVVCIFLLYILSGKLLTVEKPVKSPYVLLEDWVSYTTVEDASAYIVENNIDSVFVIGMRESTTSRSLQEVDKTRKLQKDRNTYSMYWNGTLGFEIPSEKLQESSILHVKMRGTSDYKHYPHYTICLNKQVIGSGFVNEAYSAYEFILSGKTTDSLSYILINFDNDKSTSTGDRNLYVSDIYIDSMDIDSIARDHFFISEKEMVHINYASKLNTIKYYLKDLEYEPSRVKLIEVDYDNFNRSLALAKGAKKYFEKTEITNINVITVDMHARRSYLNFKNCLEGNIEVGCFPGNSDTQRSTSVYEGIDERISLLLTWIYWWIY